MKDRVPDPPAVIPPTPNLGGDDVRFVRRGPDGSPLNWGHMHRDHFDELVAKGEKIEEVAEDFVPPAPVHDESLRARFLIAGALERSDRYFTADALDNIAPAEQEKWRAYRKALRAASKLDKADAILANVPADPKGVDLAAPMRSKGKPNP